jgi:predicted metal-binding membrane protein
MTARLRGSLDAHRFYLALGALILVAWGLLIAWQRSAYAELLSHEVIEDGGFPPLLRLAAFLLSWFSMTVAMMLPGALPLLHRAVQPLRRGAAGRRLAGLTILGYLAPWVLFGVVIYLGDSLLHHLAEPAAPLAAYSGSIAPGIMLFAGFYQLTPLKRSSAALCQSSQPTSLSGSMEKLSTVGALRQGLRLGVFCMGSCWSLMLLMFATGHNRLEWMLVLGGIMAAERLTPWGRRLSWPVGFTLILWATAWVLGVQSIGLH